VLDLQREVEFYEEVLGLQLLADDGATGAMGTAAGRPLVVLHGEPGAPRRRPGTTGLFHFALRLPSRSDLGALVRRVQNSGRAFEGFGDHNVSEAAYLSDAEGNGIELYADRSEEVWRGVDGEIFMTTEPLDVPGLLMAAQEASTRMPDATVVGHVHLRVSSLEAAEAFYVERLGFDVVTRSYPGALFASAGGYHHHVGLNVWGGEGAPRPPEGSQGLMYFEVAVPSERVRNALLGDAAEGYLMDPDNVGVRITRR
jgi:catechol 2,3-dioxygenase